MVTKNIIPFEGILVWMNEWKISGYLLSHFALYFHNIVWESIVYQLWVQGEN